MSMNIGDVLQVLKQIRTQEVVVATMGSSREWLKISQHPRDFIYVPSTMGQAPTLGLGLALARPDLRIIVFNGDGCMLMNLGCLATIAAQAPRNYALLVFQNGVYEVTGAQPTAAGNRFDFAAVAKAAGIEHARHFSDLESWRNSAPELIATPGPVFASLDVVPITTGSVSPQAPCPIGDQIERFVAALGGEG